jgi:LSD1 subclass zinc finger protein
MIIVCTSCGRSLKVSDSAQGKRVRCPKCQTTNLVPAAATGQEAEYQLVEEAPSTAPPRTLDLPEPGTRRAPMHVYAQRVAAAAELSREVAESLEPSPARRWLYLLFAGTLIPLGFSVLHPRDDVVERLRRSVQSQPDLAQKVESDAGLDGLLGQLPGGKIEGAHLPRQTWVHWGYAAVATALFLALALLLFDRGNARLPRMLLIGLFTGTAGIMLLLGFQWVAEYTQGFNLRGRGVVVLLFYVVKFIGFSYRAALDPENGFLLSFTGFTFGVGLCEELCKALPLLIHFAGRASLNWRGALICGLASGAGFGISEAVHYAGEYYNGLSGLEIYVVRFVSCVALHAIWTGTVGLLVFAGQAMLQGADEWYEYPLVAVLFVSGPMILHGLYDTLLKRDMDVAALVVAAVSFVAMGVAIERNHQAEAA